MHVATYMHATCSIHAYNMHVWSNMHAEYCKHACYMHDILTRVHINHAGRLLRKTEYQYCDFYIQLAAHFLLEVYQETGTVYCYTILRTV